MAITKSGLQAICQDCGAKFTGSLTLRVVNYGAPYLSPLAEGRLLSLCARHHNTEKRVEAKRKKVPLSDPSLLDHNFFLFYEGSSLLGEATAPSAMHEVGFRILNPELREEMWREAVRIRKEREGF